MKKPTNKPDPKISKQRVIEVLEKLKKKTFRYKSVAQIDADFTDVGDMKFSDAIQKIKEMKI